MARFPLRSVLAASMVILPLAACSPGSTNSASPTTITVTQEIEAPATAESVTPEATPKEATKSADAAPSSPAAPANKIIPVEALYSVWVPALCEHQAGYLVNGKLPEHLKERPMTSAHLAKNADGSPLGAYTDINGDGRDEAVLAYNCDRGGVSWPLNLIVYDNDLNYITHFNDWQTGQITAQRSNISSMTWDDSAVYIEGLGWGPSDVAAAPSFKMTYRFTLPGNKPLLEVLESKPVTR